MIVGTFFNDIDATESKWNNINFENSDLKRVEFFISEFENVNFVNVRLEVVSFRNCTLRNVDFGKSYFLSVNFFGATLKNVTFNSGELHKVDFAFSTMENVDFGSTLLEEVSFRESSIDLVSFKNSKQSSAKRKLFSVRNSFLVFQFLSNSQKRNFIFLFRSNIVGSLSLIFLRRVSLGLISLRRI